MSRRLSAIASMIPACECLADIGCDHGELVETALAGGIAHRAIACDVSGPSLRKAMRRLSGWTNVDFRCGDGLHVLYANEADVICIAGMGGQQMKRILSENPAVARRARALVLSPHRNAAELRAYLRAGGYRITRERIVEEKGHYYTVMLVVPGHDPQTDPFWNEFAHAEKADTAYLGYAEHMVFSVQRTISALEKAHRDEGRVCALKEREQRLREELQWIRNSLERS